MDWLNTVQGLIALLTGLFGLISTGVTTFFLVRSFIQKNKDNTAAENWKLIMAAADAAMKSVEESGTTGSENKKEMAVAAIKKSCEAMGLDIAPFMDQLNAYIDQAIAFVNGMTK